MGKSVARLSVMMLRVFVGIAVRAHRERPNDSDAAEKRDEAAPFYCQASSVFPTERIAHICPAGGDAPGFNPA